MQSQPASPTTSRSTLRTIHILLAVQSVLAVLVSINRLSSLTTGYVLPNEFLRWVDFNNMLILPIIAAITFYLVKKQLEYPSAALNSRWHLLFNILFILGLYLIAASYGDHEVTNYLHGRFCPDSDTSTLCNIIRINDDDFSHLVFFTGFVVMNAAILFIQVLFPIKETVTGRDRVFLIINGLFISGAVFANLGFEEIGLDLYVVGLLVILSVFLLRRYGSQPLIIYYTTAYSVGSVATLIYKLFFYKH